MPQGISNSQKPIQRTGEGKPVQLTGEVMPVQHTGEGKPVQRTGEDAKLQSGSGLTGTALTSLSQSAVQSGFFWTWQCPP